MYQLGIETGPMVPTDLYPPATVPLQVPPSDSEREAAAQFYKFQAEVRDGPLYTGSVEVKTTASGAKKSSRILIEVDDACDDGIRRYTDKYRKKRKVGRSIDEHPYILELFPQELHEAMGVKSAASGEDVKRRRAGISKFANSLIQADEGNLTPAELEARLKAQQALAVEDDKELEARLGREAADSEEEEIEDDVYDDEDDNDYNAEGYFDNGDGDDDDGDDDEANF